mmetsp:Transcript_55568/g.147740  ORF Transcript_55568/g.147740 Transcript_55568/m.147740 type:complete len:217 (+) Transcript_55568:465-1115(+)
MMTYILEHDSAVLKTVSLELRSSGSSASRQSSRTRSGCLTRRLRKKGCTDSAGMRISSRRSSSSSVARRRSSSAEARGGRSWRRSMYLLSRRRSGDEIRSLPANPRTASRRAAVSCRRPRSWTATLVSIQCIDVSLSTFPSGTRTSRRHPSARWMATTRRSRLSVARHTSTARAATASWTPCWTLSSRASSTTRPRQHGGHQASVPWSAQPDGGAS